MLSVGDGLPAQACIQCMHQVNASYSFKLWCETTDVTLRQLQSQLQENSNETEVAVCDLTVVKDEVVEPEITVEDSSFRSFSNGEEHRFGGENIEGTAYIDNCKCSSLEQIETTPFTQNMRTIKDVKDGTLECDVCGKLYASLRSLKRYGTTHSDQKP